MLKIESDKRLLRILAEQSTPEHNYLEEIEKLKQNAMQKDIIIPFIGVQGVGKSTLLNAVIGEEILPNEVAETTCVPVEIRYAESDRAEVHFKDGTVKNGLCTKDDLSIYVDNNYNPGNEKNVEKIIVYRQYPILKSGLVFVDLPGVGSLTQSNEKTTKDYLKNVCVAVFVIADFLKGCDAGLIKHVWSSVSSAFFVVNNFEEVTEEDFAIALNHNKTEIKKIARELKFMNNPEILVLNAYNAALGSYKRNQKLIDDSGLPALLAVLAKFQRNYKIMLEAGFEGNVRRYIELAGDRIDNKIQSAQLSTDELEAKLKKEIEEFSDNNEKIQKTCNEINDYLEDKNKDMKIFAKTVADETGTRLRFEIFNRIDQGLVDGSLLQKAFEDLQKKEADEVFERIERKFSEIQEDLQEKLQEIDELINAESWSPESIDFHKTEALKWEKGMEFGFKLGGAAAGWFVGGPVGFAVFLAFGFLGNKIKETKMNQRKRQTKEQIQPFIDEFKNSIIEAVTIQFGNLEKTVNVNLNSYVNDRRAFSEKMKTSIDTIKTEAEKNKVRIGDLKADHSYLKEWVKTRYEQ